MWNSQHRSLTQLGALLGIVAAAAAVLWVSTSRVALQESSRADETSVPSDRADIAFLSQRGCKKCHFRIYRSWRKTPHARTFDILKPGKRAEAKRKARLGWQKDYTQDATCLPCHVTGYGELGGYPYASDSWSYDQQKVARNNHGVGCESCHGRGEQYVPYKKEHQDYKRSEVVARGLVTPVTAAMCRACHNLRSPTASRSRTFDADAFMGREDLWHERRPLEYGH